MIFSIHNNITICEILLEAYNYVVNGKSALEWVMDRQKISFDTKSGSGIENDANGWAIETMKIVKNLPKFDI